MDVPSGPRLFQIQTTEKIPTRVILTARGSAGHGSLPRPDNPVVRLARAIARVADTEQPVRLNTTTRRYFTVMSRINEYSWLAPLLPNLSNEQTAAAMVGQIRGRDPELDAQLHTTISATMLSAGMKINVIPNSAQGQLDIRRLPNETRQEVLARLRRIDQRSAVDIAPAPGQEMPATEPSSLTTALYKKMEEVFQASSSNAKVIPYMQRGATDGSFLRQKGMAVYGIPAFLREDRTSRAHGNDERISVKSLEAGAGLLWDIVLAVSR